MSVTNPDILPINQVHEDPESGAALDKLFEGLDETPVPVADVPVVEEAPVVEDAPTVDEPVVEDEPRVPTVEDTPVTPVAEEDPILKLIEQYKISDTASQKSKDTFANLKKLSEEAVRLEKQSTVKIRAEYEAKLAAAEASKVAPVADPVADAELKKLREFRATFDIENDPEFQKTFTARLESNYNSIYGVLANHGLPESELKALKDLPEAERVSQIGDLIEKLPNTSKMRVQAKLMDNLNLDEDRSKALNAAIEKARTSKQEILEAPVRQKEQTLAALKTAAEQYRTAPVFKKAEIASSTPPEEKKRLEAANQAVDKYTKLFNDVIADETPAAKAEAAYGIVLAHHFKAQVDTLSAQLKKATDELGEIKKRSGVSDKGRVVNVPNTTRPRIDNLDGGSALDALAREAGMPT